MKVQCIHCGQIAGERPSFKYCERLPGGDPDGKNPHCYKPVVLMQLQKHIKAVIDYRSDQNELIYRELMQWCCQMMDANKGRAGK